MKKIFILIVSFFCCFFYHCSNNKHFEYKIVDVINLSDSIYCEEYLYYGGGVFGGEIIYSYITDSISFRKYVGKYDDNSMIIYKTDTNNRIDVYKIIDIGLWEHKYDTALLKSYYISSLKKNNIFDIPCKEKIRQ